MVRTMAMGQRHYIGEEEIMQPEFDFLVAYIWCAKALLLTVALFLTVVISGWVVIFVANTVIDKWNRTKYGGK